MTTKQIQLVKNSWSLVAQMDPVTVGDLFYNRLFDIMPEVKPLFRHAMMPEQSKKLLSMIGYVINKLDRLDDILDEVSKLAQRHVSYGVREAHYYGVGSALLWTLQQGLGEQWTDEVETSWTVCYDMLSSAMIQASSVPGKVA
ncbi:MAG: globin domain-containing protein [Chitinophagaceae bacterium]